MGLHRVASCAELLVLWGENGSHAELLVFWGENGALGGNGGQMVQVGHSTWLSGLLESHLCLYPALLLEGVW